MNKLFCLLFAALSFLPVMAQEKGVPFNGLVMSAEGLPLKRVKVYIKSPDKYAISDKKGRFGLTNVSENDTLKIFYKKKGYLIPVEGRKSARIRLADASILQVDESQELVDMGYGFVKRREYTGASNRLSGEEFRRMGFTSLSRALQGRVPGLSIGNNNGTTNMNIRGINSIYGSSQPLIMVDGTEAMDLDSVDINDVDYVEVLKDSNIYGVRGANGVILITTLTGNSKRK